MKRTTRQTTQALLLAALGGCAAGPDFQPPAPPATAAFTAEALPAQTASAAGPGGAAQGFVPGQAVPTQWWKAFGSPALDALVAEALQASPDLQAAEAALRAAHEAVAVQRGSLWPSVDIGLNTTRQKTPGPLASPLVDADVALYTLHTAQLSIGYVPDVFGGTRRQIEAASAQAQVQRFQREGVYMALVANLVHTAIGEASLRAQIAVAHELVALAARLLDTTRRAQHAGLAGAADVAAQEAALAQAQTALAPLEKQLAEHRHRLAVLAGRPPSTPVAPPFTLAELRLPVELPLSLPAQLVEQRPDVRAARAQLQAASAQIGVAAAARLPHVTLTATLGSSALGLSQLLRSGSGSWAVGGDLLQPLLRGGALAAQQRAAEAAHAQAAAQYQSTVLTALQNTADTLQAIVSDAEALRAASAAEAAARSSLRIARRQYELGAAPLAPWLLARQNHQTAALALVQAQAARYTNTVALYLALGGWWLEAGDTPGG